MRPYLKLGKPEHRPERVSLDDHQIVSIYGSDYRGIIQYYLLAGDVWRLRRLHWVMLTSMLKTSRPVSNGTAGNRWWHGSAEFRCASSATRS